MNNKLNSNLQDIFLNNARKNKIAVNIRLLNGYSLKGFVTGFDSFTVFLDCNGEQILIYKHGISTITPQKPILYNNNLNK
ncbi:RNA chaperone Hfq [Hathewaya histolytica]|uniref:RNA-binding protein Hfq n=1 Tax=Hathewaya histolytica TaxID=1498 RepID=A0A4U9RC73_HATHI|nr:RNA chaperone Hfq [Hathewaya histolytica]VTQ89345.1 RNA chaperone Hfq [Hathewaya histolytica]